MSYFVDRLNAAVLNNLGVVRASQGYDDYPRYRCKKLHDLENHLNSMQFDGLKDWNESLNSNYYVPVKERKPAIIYPLPQIITNRVNKKLTGRNTFPKITLEEDEETQFLVEEIHKAVDFEVYMKEAIEKLLGIGAAFVRIKIINGILGLECYSPNNCWPVFDDNGELESIEIRYVYESKTDKGEIKNYWYKFTMNKGTDTLFDNPEYQPGEKPKFNVVSSVNHNLGFVQGEWVKSTKNPHQFEGKSVFKEVMDFGNCLSYVFTLQGGAVEYGAEPQILLTGMMEGEIDDLVKRKEKAWALGREGDAKYLEASGTGTATAEAFDVQMGKKIAEITSVIMHDPEKFSAHAQSGKAMEMLNEPMVELVEDFRPYIEGFFKRLSIKMLVSLLIMSKRNLVTDFNIPGSYKPKSLNLNVEFGPVYPMSIADKQAEVTYLTTLTNANILSRQTALEIMVKNKLIENVDVAREVNLVNTQKEFGGFF